jgi:two-component sensor histidine kinase
MSSPAMGSQFFGAQASLKRQLQLLVTVFFLIAGLFVVWPRLSGALFATNFLPHAYCYLQKPALVWTHVVADALIGVSYLAISVTLAYLVSRARRDIPFPWMFVAFGLFIIACGGTHLVEAVTVWIPVYVFSAALKLFTVAASITTAIILPFTVPRVLELVRQAKASEQITSELRASEERKEALLREVHHRVKNNLAVICSLLHLQSTHTQDPKTTETFCDMETRIHSMALVHESLYSSENLARVDFAEYAKRLAEGVLASYEKPSAPVCLQTDLEPVEMNADLALPCGLILNELISNACKHGFPEGVAGLIKLGLRSAGEPGKYTLSVHDDGIGIAPEIDVNTTVSLGLRLVRLLTQQIHGSFELTGSGQGTSARLEFIVDQ